MNEQCKPMLTPRILILHPGALGDGIISLPLIRLLKREWNQGNVTCELMGHMDKHSYLVGRSDISKVISIDDIQLHRLFINHNDFELEDGDELIHIFGVYDLIVTFLNDEQNNVDRNLAYISVTNRCADIASLSLKPPTDYAKHSSDYYIDQFFSEIPHCQLTLHPDMFHEPLIRPTVEDHQEGIAQLAKTTLPLPGHKNLILIHPGSGAENKCWPIENYLQLAKKLRDHGKEPLFILGPVERERWNSTTLNQLNEQFATITDLPLDKVAAILSCVDGYIGNDSGISHLAGAMDIDTTAIFGPTNPIHWKPLGRKSRSLQENAPTAQSWPTVEKVFSECIAKMND